MRTCVMVIGFILIAGGIAAADESRLDPLFELPEKLADEIVHALPLDIVETRGDLEDPFATYLHTLLSDDKILHDQDKALLRAFKEVYLDRYEIRTRPPEEWRGADYVVLPVVFAGYTWQRGIDQQIGNVTFHVEPIRDIVECLEDDDELRAAAGLEFDLPCLPLKFVATAGIYDGDVEMDFVGVATSYGAARSAIRSARAR